MRRLKSLKTIRHRLYCFLFCRDEKKTKESNFIKSWGGDGGERVRQKQNSRENFLQQKKTKQKASSDDMRWKSFARLSRRKNWKLFF
jgi:hypothetical protein